MINTIAGLVFSEYRPTAAKLNVIYFVNIQGFQYGEEFFLCKEIAILAKWLHI